jgi:Inverse autotransporter, beta-domain/Right handed beta helix region
MSFIHFSKFLLLNSLFFIAFSSSAIAQVRVSEYKQKNPKTLQEADFSPRQVNLNLTQAPGVSENSAVMVLPRFGADFTTGAGVGYERSFTGIEGFVPLLQKPGENLTFFQGKLLIDNNSNFGGNLVLGHRFYSPEDKLIVGGYIAYDLRDTDRNDFRQIGTGFEALSDFWDFRANAYIPVGNTRKLVQENSIESFSPFSEPFFQGNFLAQNRTRTTQINRSFQAAMMGFDVEGGVKIAQIGTTGDVRGYGGIYYYNGSSSSDIFGWRTRLEARPNDNFRLGLSLSHDETFGTNFIVSVGTSFPGTRPRGVKKEESALARLSESVFRQANIVIKEERQVESFNTQETLFVNNPVTGQPWRFRHVTLGATGGNANFESPAGTVNQALSLAQANDIVYVQPGTNPGIPSFTIPDGVQVLSNGVTQRIDTVQLGNIVLPLSRPGTLPTVIGTATMGNNTTLSGFAISPTTGAGISGNGISNFTIRDNIISNSTASGISLLNVNGTGIISNNTVRGSRLDGINLSSQQGQVNFQITNSDGINIELNNSAQGTFNISNNSVTNNRGSGETADGIDIRVADNARGTFNITNNTISGNQFRGIANNLVGSSTSNFNITGNTINNNVIGVDFSMSDNSQATADVSNNNLVNSLRGVDMILSNNTSGTFNISRNTITDNQDSGVNIFLSDNARGTVNITNNPQISRNQLNAVAATTNNTSQLRLTIESNQIQNNTTSGVNINSFDDSTIFTKVSSNGINDFKAQTFGFNDRICLQAQNNTIGTVFIDASFGGPIQLEDGTLNTNTISSPSVTGTTTVPRGNCGFP